jgi:hypothetical protein
MPIAAAGALPAGAEMGCGFCGHSARVRDYLVRDVYDTVGNEAQLVARII